MRPPVAVRNTGPRALRSLALVSALAGACSGRGASAVASRRPPLQLSSAASGAVVARVNGVALTAGEVETAARISGIHDVRAAVERAVTDRLLAREARRRGTAALLEEDAVRRALVQALLVREVNDVVTPQRVSPETYESARAFFGYDIAHGPTTTVKHTVLRFPEGRAPTAEELSAARAVAERLRTALLALPAEQRAERIAAVSAEVAGGQRYVTESIGPFDAGGHAPNGQGFAPPFAQAGAALARPGDVSPVTQTPFGFHVLVMTERGPAVEMSDEEFRARVLERALPQLRQQRVEAVLRGLRTSGRVAISEGALRAVDRLDLTLAPSAPAAAPAEVTDPRARDNTEESP